VPALGQRDVGGRPNPQRRAEGQHRPGGPQDGQPPGLAAPPGQRQAHDGQAGQHDPERRDALSGLVELVGGGQLAQVIGAEVEVAQPGRRREQGGHRDAVLAVVLGQLLRPDGGPALGHLADHGEQLRPGHDQRDHGGQGQGPQGGAVAGGAQVAECEPGAKGADGGRGPLAPGPPGGPGTGRGGRRPGGRGRRP
jgi:hypothetical protein